MRRRVLITVFVAGVLAALAPLFFLDRRLDEVTVQKRVAGDVEEVVRSLEEDELVAQGRAFLATDRPWRASRALERYLDVAPDPAPDHVVLAARAEAGWGGWPETRALLDTLSALDTYEDGLGVYLLGRARDDAGDAAGAVEDYRAFLAFSPPTGDLEPERRAARLRLAMALIRTGDPAAGREELAALEDLEGLAGLASSPWIRILRAEALAATGDTAGVRAAVSEHDSGIRGIRAWRARVAAAEAAGDLAEARSLANQARSWAGTTDTRAEFLLLAGRMALAMGDEDAARDAFRGVIDRNPASAHARAAADLLLEDDLTPADALAVARVRSAMGLHTEAIEGYERWLDSGGGTPAERAEAHMAHATSLFYAGRYREVEDALRSIASRNEARFLMARADAHRGRTEAAVERYLAMAEEYDGSATGVTGLFLAAGTLHDAGETDRARELYRDVVHRYPGTDRMGLALMRLAGMAFQEGDHAAAARLWDQYRTRYPRGDRVLQATYWAGRARAEAGDSAGAAALFREVRQAERDSYYALLASRRLGEPFWPIPLEASPPVGADPDAARRLAAWMAELDLLRRAGYEDAASARADELAATTGLERPTRYALAEALAERGYSQGGIRIGIGLQGSGAPSRRLLRILYPFPYRTLITEEARDRGLDPFVAAALIRQESMFEARITSPAGARGLMQVMPATGRQLAEAVGMERWDPELLYHPEINVHLGIRYVAQFMDEYDGSLPSVFSAYNAGPHRVEWWSEYPEYGDDELFTERIPYRETRDYVKILTRNRALYAGLYGGEVGGDGETGRGGGDDGGTDGAGPEAAGM